MPTINEAICFCFDDNWRQSRAHGEGGNHPMHHKIIHTGSRIQRFVDGDFLDSDLSAHAVTFLNSLPCLTSPCRASPRQAGPCCNSLKHPITTHLKPSEPTIAGAPIVANSEATAGIVQNVDDEFWVRHCRIVLHSKCR